MAVPKMPTASNHLRRAGLSFTAVEARNQHGNQATFAVVVGPQESVSRT